MKTASDLVKQYISMFDLLKLPPILPHQVAMFVGEDVELMVYSMNVELLTAIKAVTDGYIEALNNLDGVKGTVFKLNADLMTKNSDFNAMKAEWEKMSEVVVQQQIEVNDMKRSVAALAEQHLNERIGLHSKIITLKEQLDNVTAQHQRDESMIHDLTIEIKMKDAVIDNLRDESEQVTNELMLAHKRDMRLQRKRGRKVYHVDWDTMVWLSTEKDCVRFEDFINANNIGIGEGSIIKNELELGHSYTYRNERDDVLWTVSLRKPRQTRDVRVRKVTLDQPVKWWEEQLMNLLSGHTSVAVFDMSSLYDVIIDPEDAIKELERLYTKVCNWISRHNKIVRTEKTIKDKRVLHIHWVKEFYGPKHQSFQVRLQTEVDDIEF